MILSSVILTAQPGKARGGYYGWSDQLNLTTEQIKEINTLRTEYMKERMSAQADVASLRLDLRQLMIAEDPNQRKIKAQLKKIHTKEAAIEDVWVQHRLNIRAQLTEEQRVLYDSKPMLGRGGNGRGNGRGSGRGFNACDGSGPNGRRGNMNW